MSRRTVAAVIPFLALCCITSVALSDPTPTARAGGTATAQTSGTASATAPSEPGAAAESRTEARADARLDAILQKGARISERTRAETDAKLEASARRLESIPEDGQPQVAQRMGAEFGMTADAALAEKQALGVSWGEWMIAHTILANSAAELTMEELFQMRAEGGWGQIAGGLGLRLGEVVSATQAETRVALGLAKADGHVAVVHGAGAKAQTAAATGAKAEAGKVGKVNAGVNAGVGVKIDHP